MSGVLETPETFTLRVDKSKSKLLTFSRDQGEFIYLKLGSEEERILRGKYSEPDEYPVKSISAITIKNAVEDLVPKTGGQGYLSDAVLRKETELYAVSKAIELYKSDGYEVLYVTKGNERPYDIELSKNNKTVHVEVKGSQSSLGSIILTKNEVEHANQSSCRVDLIVVSDIVIHETEEQYLELSGGSINHYVNWKLDSKKLVATQFSYRLVERSA